MKARSAAMRNDCLIKKRFVYGNAVRQKRRSDTRKTHTNVLVGLPPIATRAWDFAALGEIGGGKLRSASIRREDEDMVRKPWPS